MIHETKSSFVAKINIIDKSLARVIQEKKDSNKIRN